jgi:hypothetical protein
MVKGTETTYFMTAAAEAYMAANSDLLTLLLIYVDALTQTSAGRQSTTLDEIHAAVGAGAAENRDDPEWAQLAANQELVAAQLEDLLAQAVAQGLLAAAQD